MQPDWQVPKVHSDQLATAVTPKHGKRGIHNPVTLGKQDIHNYAKSLLWPAQKYTEKIEVSVQKYKVKYKRQKVKIQKDETKIHTKVQNKRTDTEDDLQV